MENLTRQLPPPFLVLGDFNAHNTRWGETFTDRKGRMIESLIDNNNLSLLNDGSHTFYNVAHNNSSAIDLSLCTPDIFLDYFWSVNNNLYGSDHWPIHLKSATNSPESSSPKWKTEDANWSKYASGIIIDRKFESYESHIEAYNSLSDKIIHSANDSIPKREVNLVDQ